MKIFNLIDYKGKHEIIKDQDYPYDYMDFVCGTITKEEALRPVYIKYHKANCKYYGIPCYVGDDEDLLKVYK